VGGLAAGCAAVACAAIAAGSRMSMVKVTKTVPAMTRIEVEASRMNSVTDLRDLDN